MKVQWKVTIFSTFSKTDTKNLDLSGLKVYRRLNFKANFKYDTGTAIYREVVSMFVQHKLCAILVSKEFTEVK